jgi:hypothetical protein
MSAEQRTALRWAVKLLDSFLLLTGCDLRPESKANLETLRGMVKP